MVYLLELQYYSHANIIFLTVDFVGDFLNYML